VNIPAELQRTVGLDHDLLEVRVQFEFHLGDRAAELWTEVDDGCLHERDGPDREGVTHDGQLDFQLLQDLVIALVHVSFRVGQRHG